MEQSQKSFLYRRPFGTCARALISAIGLAAFAAPVLVLTTPALTLAASSQPLFIKKKQSRIAYRGELDRLIRENRVACKISLDCEALPLGTASCGGPSEFIILSKATRMKISDAVTDLTKTITEMDQTANSESGMAGVCVVLEKPEIACRSGSCVAADAK